MFDFIKQLGKNKELEALAAEIDSNLSNNYKDAAQESFTQFEQKLHSLTAQGKLKETVRKEYEAKRKAYQKTLTGFSHKDQKPYWESK